MLLANDFCCRESNRACSVLCGWLGWDLSVASMPPELPTSTAAILLVFFRWFLVYTSTGFCAIPGKISVRRSSYLQGLFSVCGLSDVEKVWSWPSQVALRFAVEIFRNKMGEDAELVDMC